MIDDGMTQEMAAFLATRGHSDNFRDLSADEVRAMDWAEYCRRTGRDKTPSQLAVEAFHAAQDALYASQTDNSTPPVANVPEAVSEPVTGVPGQITQEQFLQWRSQRGGQGENRGIFDSVGSQSQAYRDAAGRQAGRNAMVTSNVVEPPRLPRQFARTDDFRDTRSLADRFSLPGNSYQG